MLRSSVDPMNLFFQGDPNFDMGIFLAFFALFCIVFLVIILKVSI